MRKIRGLLLVLLSILIITMLVKPSTIKAAELLDSPDYTWYYGSVQYVNLPITDWKRSNTRYYSEVQWDNYGARSTPSWALIKDTNAIYSDVWQPNKVAGHQYCAWTLEQNGVGHPFTGTRIRGSFYVTPDVNLNSSDVHFNISSGDGLSIGVNDVAFIFVYPANIYERINDNPGSEYYYGKFLTELVGGADALGHPTNNNNRRLVGGTAPIDWWSDSNFNNADTVVKYGYTLAIQNAGYDGTYIMDIWGADSSTWGGCTRLKIGASYPKYTQTIYVRYQNPDATWGNYVLAKQESCLYGVAGPVWSRAADSVYKAAGTNPYTVTGAKTQYVDVYRNSYKFKLQYNANQGTGAPGEQTYEAVAPTHTFTISNTRPTRTGYTFVGWSESSTATTASYQPGGTISVAADSTKTLYAVWNSIEYNIYYNKGLTSDILHRDIIGATRNTNIQAKRIQDAPYTRAQYENDVQLASLGNTELIERIEGNHITRYPKDSNALMGRLYKITFNSNIPSDSSELVSSCDIADYDITGTLQSANYWKISGQDTGVTGNLTPQFGETLNKPNYTIHSR